MTKRLWILGGALALVIAAGAYAIPGEDHPAGSIGAGYVEITEDHLIVPSVVEAFIPTRSTSQRCLVTLSESNFAVAGISVHCNARFFNGVDGVRVRIDFPFDAPNDLSVTMTVYQQFAKGYGQPVLYTG